MKKSVFVTTLTLLVTVISFGQVKFDNWPQMKTFHSVLSETFHPAEEGDMKPIKSRSHELFVNAKMVSVSPIPDNFDNELLRKTLKRLEKETDKLNAIIVRQEQNTTIMKQLNIVHDTFHEIVGICKKTEK